MDEIMMAQNIFATNSGGSNPNVEALLLDAVDEELTLLGDQVKEAIYLYLEKAAKVQKGEIPSRIDVFAEVLEKIFGHGAKILEIQIMRRLHEKIGHDSEFILEREHLLFTDYVKAVIC